MVGLVKTTSSELLQKFCSGKTTFILKEKRTMKQHNNIKPTGNFEADYMKAMKRFAREEYGFQPARMTKNKKKYDRKNEKRKLLRDSEAFYFYSVIIFKEPEKWK